jgi:hypothetical protein
MIGIIKIAAVGAALSYGGALVYDLPVRKLEIAVSSKYQDRIPSSDDGPIATTRPIEQPPVFVGTPGAGKGDRLTARQEPTARLVTIESREGENTSILVRQPQTIIAQR